MTDARPARLSALRALLTKEMLDGLLISGLANLRYLTGFSGSSAMLVVTARDATLVTDFRYETQAAEECEGACDVRIEASSLWKGVWDTIGDGASVRTYGFEGLHLTHRDAQRFSDQERRIHWRPTHDLVEGLRVVKDVGEVAAVRSAGWVATTALGRVLDQVRAGLTELQVCGILEHALRDAGSEAHPFPPIVAGGPRTALPHARASQRVLLPGDFLLLDFGATVQGYCSDITRTVVIGLSDAKQQEVYDVVLQAHAKAVDGVKAGMSGREADALARGYIVARGYGDEFGHGLGHGVGLEVHEAPRLSRTAEGTLPAGAVVTIEPGVYVPEWGGVRIEDDVLVGENDCDVLTSFPRDLIEIGR